jgi:hypothetical protein
MGDGTVQQFQHVFRSENANIVAPSSRFAIFVILRHVFVGKPPDESDQRVRPTRLVSPCGKAIAWKTARGLKIQYCIF